MPTRDRPEPPTDLDPEARAAVAALEDLEPDELRAIGRYLEDLASRRESTESDGEREATDESGAEADADHEYPADVPERAEVTVKEIAGTTYYYYQWRDGDRIESKTVQRQERHRMLDVERSPMGDRLAEKVARTFNVPETDRQA